MEGAVTDISWIGTLMSFTFAMVIGYTTKMAMELIK
jgi:hypothetical protein